MKFMQFICNLTLFLFIICMDAGPAYPVLFSFDFQRAESGSQTALTSFNRKLFVFSFNPDGKSVCNNYDFHTILLMQCTLLIL